MTRGGGGVSSRQLGVNPAGLSPTIGFDVDQVLGHVQSRAHILTVSR